MVARFEAIIVLPLLLFLGADTNAQARIQSLDRNDPVYQQHQQLVAEYYQLVGQGNDPPPLFLFAYQTNGEESLFSLAARLMLPYASIATLNRLQDPSVPSGDILVPSQPGVFVFRRPETSFEQRLFARLYEGSAAITREFTLPGGDDRVFFYHGIDFAPPERDDFFRVRFRNPLPGAQVSSRFGYRIHPISGVWSFHNGIDLVADFGTAVTTTAQGIVRAIDRDPWLGLTITIDHGNGYSSVYAHLQESTVMVGDIVAEDATIGYVGSTGLSTGPHLHFELRFRNESRNPEQYFEWR